MKKHFYHHLIEIDTIHIALDDLDLSPEEKQDLVIIIDNNMHHTIMDIVLSELSEKDKKDFLALVIAEDHGEVWQVLHEKIENVEEKIKKAAQILAKKLHDDIREAHVRKIKG